MPKPKRKDAYLRVELVIDNCTTHALLDVPVKFLSGRAPFGFTIGEVAELAHLGQGVVELVRAAQFQDFRKKLAADDAPRSTIEAG